MRPMNRKACTCMRSPNRSSMRMIKSDFILRGLAHVMGSLQCSVLALPNLSLSLAATAFLLCRFVQRIYIVMFGPGAAYYTVRCPRRMGCA